MKLRYSRRKSSAYQRTHRKRISTKRFDFPFRPSMAISTCYFRKRLQEHGIIQSMSRKGNCYDNCIMETFFGRIKTEMYYGFEKDYASFEEFAVAIDEYIDYYNNKRIQAKTKWMLPVKYREASTMST